MQPENAVSTSLISYKYINIAYDKSDILRHEINMIIFRHTTYAKSISSSVLVYRFENILNTLLIINQHKIAQQILGFSSQIGGHYKTHIAYTTHSFKT